MYYLRSMPYYKEHEIWKKNDTEEGLDRRIATFTCLIHAEIALDVFNEVKEFAR